MGSARLRIGGGWHRLAPVGPLGELGYALFGAASTSRCRLDLVERNEPNGIPLLKALAQG